MTLPWPIAELYSPGSRIVAIANAEFELSGILGHAKTHLAGANMALIDFQESRVDAPKTRLGQFVAEYEERLARLRVTVADELGLSEAAVRDSPTLNLQVEVRAKHENWSLQGLPNDIARRRQLNAATAFIFAVYQIGIELKHLGSKHGQAVSAHSMFESKFPDVKDARDCIAHIDERLRGKEKKRDIAIQPDEDPMVNVPGKVFYTGNLVNDVFTATAASGHIVRVAISEANLFDARDCVQAAIDTLTWSGEPSHWPNYAGFWG